MHLAVTSGFARAVALLAVATIAATGCLGSDDEADPSPPAESIAEPPTPAKRLASVRRSPPGLLGKPASAREVALAERIMAANPFLGRIADAGGGYRIRDFGLVNGPGRDRILGLVFDLELQQPVDGVYELPVVCYGVAGPPFALPPTPFRLTGVSRVIVTVTLADRRVASIDPADGHARREPGAAYLSLPSTCQRRAARDIGY
jgi:hypothetical protein